MPTYQYLCKNCGHQLEELQSMKEPPLVTCPSCSQDTLARVMGSGSGLIFKGSGFYLTDYPKNDSKKESSEKSTKKEDPKADSKPKSDSSDSKPTPPPPSQPKKE